MNNFKKWRLSLLKSIQLQLFLSLISLPLLISWGLPVSIFSLLTTIIFGPFLTSFLLISSCIFFCELLHIPNSAFIWLLEIITSTWLSILNYNQQWWLIGFATPSLPILLCIIPLALVIMHNKHINSLQSRSAWLTCILISICCIFKFFPYSFNLIEKIPCNNNELILINHENSLTLIDPGALSSRPSFESFILYNLIPEIVQKTGKMTIDHLILYKINKRTFDAISFLSTKIAIKNIYLPWWTGRIPSFAWSAYVKLKKVVFLSNGKIISLSKKIVFLNSKKSCFFIEPSTEKNIRYYNATYPSLSVKGTINKHPIEL